MKSNKFLNIAIIVVAVLGIILVARIAGYDKEVIEDDVNVQNTVISPIISFSTILLYSSVAIAIILSLVSLVRNPENLKKTLGGLAVLAVILVIAYFLSDSAAVYDANGINIIEGGEEGSSINKWVGTGIWYSVILGAIASLFFVSDLVKGLVKS